MQVQTELRPMFSYSFLAIIFITIFTILIFFIMKYFKKKNNIKNEIIIPKQKDLLLIKKDYLIKLDNLINELNENKISNRKAYQNLSSLIRNFIYEVTNIKVQNYTLTDIKKINMPILYELVSDYYDPEFAKISKGNIKVSINKTKMVIERWN